MSNYATRVPGPSVGEGAARKLLLATASSILALTAAAPAFAQDQTAGGQAQEDVVVTGIRASLQRNLDIKRNESGVVDVISAEDIGKFPDSNVASALQRLPGVAIVRSGSRGDATDVAIRGFGGDFIRTLYDGRQVSTATGGRGIDFTTIGADFVGRLSVYKTPDVELSTSAIGGTINISLPKPFDRDGFVLAASGSGSIQSRDKHVRPTGGLLVSNTFADNRFGILGTIALVVLAPLIAKYAVERVDSTPRSISAQRCETAWNEPTATPNCLRSLTYSSDMSNARWATPTTSAATAV